MIIDGARAMLCVHETPGSRGVHDRARCAVSVSGTLGVHVCDVLRKRRERKDREAESSSGTIRPGKCGREGIAMLPNEMRIKSSVCYIAKAHRAAEVAIVRDVVDRQQNSRRVDQTVVDDRVRSDIVLAGNVNVAIGIDDH